MSDISDLMHWLDPARLQASLAKPRRCDETLVRAHVEDRLYFYDAGCREAGMKAALATFGETLNVQKAIDSAVQAAMGEAA